MIMDTELLDFQKNKNSVALILKYSHLLDNLTDLCKGTHKEIDPLFRWFYGLFLNGQPRNIMNVLDAREKVVAATELLTREDCYHHILVFFLELAGRYKPKKDSGDFNHYIRMVLGWRTKNWMDMLIRRAETPVPPGLLSLHEDYMEDEEMIQPFTMDLAWVLRGSRNPLFEGLRAYERYILYLYFTLGLTMNKIAYTTYQSKNTVNADLHRIIEKCRKGSGHYNSW